jgi:hypothetical protein
LPQIGDLIRLTFWKTHMCESPRLFADWHFSTSAEMPRLRPRENDDLGGPYPQAVVNGLGFTTLYSKGYNINS